MDLGSLLGSAASGGVLGGLFSIGSSAVEFVNARAQAKEALESKKVDQAHELRMMAYTHDRERQIAEETFVLKKLDAWQEEMKANYEALNQSVQDQMILSGKVSGVALDVLALFRPSITVLLVVGAIGCSLVSQQAMADQMVQLAAMAVAWWFGDRQRRRVFN